MSYYRIVDNGAWEKVGRIAFPPALGGQILNAINHDQFSYPYNGWYWFDDDAAAEAALGPDPSGLRLPAGDKWLAMPRAARAELRDEVAAAIRDNIAAQGLGTLTVAQARAVAVAALQALAGSDYTYRTSAQEN